MDASALVAARAYAQALGGSAPQVPAAGAAAVTPNAFGALIEQQLQATAQTTQAAEAQSAQVAAGKGDLVNVVTAIAAAEVQLETMMAIRDQMIQAYQEIQRMPI